MQDTLQALLDSGCRVEFSRESDGYVAIIDDYAAGVTDGTGDSPEAALAAARRAAR